MPAGPPTSFAGSWYVEETLDRTGCGDAASTLAPHLGVITQTAVSEVRSDVVLAVEAGVLEGQVEGATATLTGVVTSGTGFRVYTRVTLVRSGAVITGSASWQESLSATGSPATCTGTSTFRAVPRMELLGFNLPNVSGVALNQPLVFTFSDALDPTSVTPDTVQVVGAASPSFDSITTDGSLLALLPRLPSFPDLSDAGLQAGTTYAVSVPDGVGAQQVVRSIHGAPLTAGGSFSFQTAAAPGFIEPRRPLIHSAGPLSGPNGRGDEDGCLNNAQNTLYVFPGFQGGTDENALLLCLVNEGPPQVVPEACSPRHDQRDVGTPSLATPGWVDLPAVTVWFNEALAPSLVEQHDGGSGLSVNVQLWRVGDVSGSPVPISASNQVPTPPPSCTQVAGGCRVVLPSGAPQPPGTYLITVRGLTDLPGNPMSVTGAPDPVAGGYGAIDATVAASVIPAGYRTYFRTP